MKQDSEIEKIRKVMGKDYQGDNSQISLSSYDANEKINAVYNWKQASSIDFNTEFIDSLSNYYHRYGKLTPNQEKALDRIINRYNINMDRWG